MKQLYLLLFATLTASFTLAQDQPGSFLELTRNLHATDLPDQIERLDKHLKKTLLQHQLGHTQLDSAKNWSWDDGLSAWYLRNQDYYTYTSNSVIILTVDENQANLSLETNLYDDNGNVIEVLNQSWNGSGWEDVYKITYQYNDHNQIVEYVSLFADEGVLENNSRASFTYDSNHATIEQIEQRWLLGEWVNFRRYTYTNNAEHRPVIQLLEDWEDAWMNNSRFLYTYGPSLELLSYTYEFWTTEWEPRIRIVNEYDDQLLLIVEQLQEYEFGVWLPTSQNLNTYDQDGNLVLATYQQNDGAGWEDVERFSYAFDEEYHLIAYVNEYWDNAWIGFDSIHYYYNVVSATHDYTRYGDLIVYPNPASASIQYQLPAESVLSGNYAVVSLDGVQRQAGELSEGLNAIDVSTLPSGLHLLIIDSDERKLYRQLFLKN